MSATQLSYVVLLIIATVAPAHSDCNQNQAFQNMYGCLGQFQAHSTTVPQGQYSLLCPQWLVFKDCVSKALQPCNKATADGMEKELYTTYEQISPYCESNCDTSSILACDSALAGTLNLGKVNQTIIYPAIAKGVCDLGENFEKSTSCAVRKIASSACSDTQKKVMQHRINTAKSFKARIPYRELCTPEPGCGNLYTTIGNVVDCTSYNIINMTAAQVAQNKPDMCGYYYATLECFHLETCCPVLGKLPMFTVAQRKLMLTYYADNCPPVPTRPPSQPCPTSAPLIAMTTEEASTAASISIATSAITATTQATEESTVGGSTIESSPAMMEQGQTVSTPTSLAGKMAMAATATCVVMVTTVCLLLPWIH